MGRELRMVPPNYEHPKDKPMRNTTFEQASSEWKQEFAAWERGEYPGYADEESKRLEFWEWHGMPPEREYYRTYKDEDATWFQVWETVSEGTPVTPAFATREELVEYLVANGDFWDQSRRREGRSLIPCGPWDRDQATKFVFGSGWAPSLVVDSGVIKTVGHGM